MPSEKELVSWVYGQVKSDAKSQAELSTAFEQEFDQSPEDVVTFLSSSKYFRKTGIGDDSTWMVSANRADDLREYLAE